MYSPVLWIIWRYTEKDTELKKDVNTGQDISNMTKIGDKNEKTFSPDKDSAFLNFSQ